MKPTRFLSALALCGALSAGVVGCDLLQETPESALSTEQFYQTSEDAMAGVDAVYASLFQGWGMYYRGIYLIVDLPTDDATIGQGVNNPNIVALDNYTYTPTNDRLALFWESTYRAINRANEAVAGVPTVAMDEALQTRLVAEARFLRALFYFNLVRLWGGVPLITEPTSALEGLNVERATADAVYAQIVEDLQFAEANLPDVFEGQDAGRASSMAAKGLLAKVYLTQEQWELAAQKAKEVIDAGYHQLMPSYAQVFLVDENPEHVFVVQSELDDGIGAFQVNGFTPKNVIPGVNGGSYDIPRAELYDVYEEGDERRDVTLFVDFTAASGETYTFPPHWFKYTDPAQLETSMEMDTDYPVLRYADVLLMHAEAVNEQGGPTAEALEHLNMVRRRAFGEDVSTPSDVDYAAGLSQAAFREAVYLERRLELANESHRRFDLVRTGRLLQALADIGLTDVEPYRILYPIPQRELDTNPELEQNEGY